MPLMPQQARSATTSGQLVLNADGKRLLSSGTNGLERIADEISQPCDCCECVECADGWAAHRYYLELFAVDPLTCAADGPYRVTVTPPAAFCLERVAGTCRFEYSANVESIGGTVTWYDAADIIPCTTIVSATNSVTINISMELNSLPPQVVATLDSTSGNSFAYFSAALTFPGTAPNLDCMGVATGTGLTSGTCKVSHGCP
jgi:hypothetical protein